MDNTCAPVCVSSESRETRSSESWYLPCSSNSAALGNSPRVLGVVRQHSQVNIERLPPRLRIAGKVLLIKPPQIQGSAGEFGSASGLGLKLFSERRTCPAAPRRCRKLSSPASAGYCFAASGFRGWPPPNRDPEAVVESAEFFDLFRSSGPVWVGKAKMRSTQEIQRIQRDRPRNRIINRISPFPANFQMLAARLYVSA